MLILEKQHRAYQYQNVIRDNGILTKHAAKKITRGIAATTRRYLQPSDGIMNIDTKTMKQVPTAQNNCNDIPQTTQRNHVATTGGITATFNTE